MRRILYSANALPLVLAFCMTSPGDSVPGRSKFSFESTPGQLRTVASQNGCENGETCLPSCSAFQ